MKKLIMMMAMAATVSAFAAQNDPLIPVRVEKGATYDVLCKGERQFSFTSNRTGLATVQGIASESANPGDYEVNLLSAASDQNANDGETSGSSGESPIASIADMTCTYKDGKVVLPGERLIVVQCDKGHGFEGFNYNGLMNDGIYNAPLKSFLASDGGKFAIEDMPGLKPELYDYYPIVLDTRLPNGVLSADSEGTPTLVRAWGEFVENEGTSVLWHEIELGGNAFAQGFDFDPTSMLADGYAAIYGMYGESDTKWYVFPTPSAYVSNLTSKVELDATKNYWAINPQPAEIGNKFALEAAYSFCAFKDAEEQELVLAVIGDMRTVDIKKLNPADVYAGEPAKQAKFYEWFVRVVPFFDWNADFEVSFDGEIAKDSVILAGSYGYHEAWGSMMPTESEGMSWAGSSVPFAMVPGKKFRLLTDNGRYDVKVSYAEICTKVREFMCGVYNHALENYGKTITVRLNLYQTKREADGVLKETGRKYTVGTYDYTFRGPLTVTFEQGPTAPKDEVLPKSFATNWDGKAAIKLDVPTYDTTIHSNDTFVGWSNSVKLVNLVYVPTNTWGDLKLWSEWKKAKTIVINPDTNKTENVASIKVADDWLEENNLKGATPEQVAETLQKPAADGGKIPLWQTYVLGLNPSGTVSVVATEKLSDDKALVVSTVEAPAPDAGFKVTYSLDKIDKTTEKPIDDAHTGEEQETKDIAIDLEPQGGETPTGYYKMNVFITPVKDDVVVKDEQVQVKSEVTVGVLTVKTEEPVVPVAIPWTSLAEAPDENAEIPASEIVQPQGLTDGDQLFVYNREGEVYTTLTLTGGKWVADAETIPVGETGTPEEPTQAGVVPTVKRGYGMWLKRQDPSKSFHLFGQYNKNAVSTKIDKGDAKKPEYNLIAPTGIEPETDLNEIKTLNPGTSTEDKLMIVKDGQPTYYNYRNGKWGYSKQVVEENKGRMVIRNKRVEDAKVTTGTGLWYISAGGEPEIKWNN